MKRLLPTFMIVLIGLAACTERADPFGTGGGVVIEDPPAGPLSIAFDSTTVQVEVGETLDIPVSVSGGEPEDAVTISCLAGDPDVLDVTASQGLQACRITAREAGFSTVTATVISDDEDASTETTVTVTDETFGS